MSRHEHFEEICATASIGQATPEELHELEEHAAHCEACGRAYSICVDFAAQNFTAVDASAELSPQEAEQCLNSELFTRRFYERAGREGIVFSDEVEGKAQVAFTPLPAFRRKFSWMNPMWAVAAVALIGLIILTGYIYRNDFVLSSPASWMSASNHIPVPSPSLVKPDPRVAELTAASLKLQAELDRVNAELRKDTGRLRATEEELSDAQNGRRQLDAARTTLMAQLSDVRGRLADSQAVAAQAQQEAAKMRDQANDADATSVAAQFRIHDLSQDLKEKTAAWNQERRLLTLGHDVTDLMGARNLHIVDVVDTDPHGGTRPAFGRIFFTEGKSLVFYAYDLNEAKIEKAGYQYRIWARKESTGYHVRSLGIFYADNKAQRRWVYKCNDPKILSEIDSVFVTLEPAKHELSEPKGPSLMYAYLRGQPNHP